MGDLVNTGHRRPKLTGWKTQTGQAGIAEPTLPTLPAVGSKYRDPTFNTTVLRATAADYSVGYSQYPALNRGNQRLMVLNSNLGGFYLYTFDPIKMLMTGGPTTPTVPAGWPIDGLIWSPKVGEEDIIYACNTSVNGPKIWKYNAANDTYSLVRDLSAVSTNYGYGGAPISTDRLITMHMSNDTMTISANLTDSSGVVRGFIVYDRTNDKIICNIADTRVNEVCVDRSGNYVSILLNPPGGVNVAMQRARDITTRTAQTQIDLYDWETGDSAVNTQPHPTKHAQFHEDATATGFVGFIAATESEFVYRDGSNLAQHYQQVYIPWNLTCHSSVLDGNPKWALASSYQDSSGVSSTTQFMREVFQITYGILSGTTQGSVRRFLHHRSLATNYDYWPIAKASVSYDGQFAVYSSNWDYTILGAGAAHSQSVFIARIPRAL